jgi:HAD superfamily hydrolase (TIGR01509 family)
MLTNYDTFIFDMDGTLVDSMGLWAEIDRKFFADRNMPYPENLTKDIEGLSMSETADYFIENFDLSESKEELMEIWNGMAADFYRSKIDMRDGAIDFLKYLKDHGYKTALATSNSRELVDVCFEANGLNELIPVVVTANEVEHGKPAPDVYLKACDLLSSNPSKCLVFEDVLAGIQGGKAAGMSVCCIDDIHSRADYEAKRDLADFYINNYLDLDVI